MGTMDRFSLAQDMLLYHQKRKYNICKFKEHMALFGKMIAHE